MHHYDLSIRHRFLRRDFLMLQPFVIRLDWHDMVDSLLLDDPFPLLCQLHIFHLFTLLLLFFLLPLQELIGSLVCSMEIDVQNYEV